MRGFVGLPLLAACCALANGCSINQYFLGNDEAHNDAAGDDGGGSGSSDDAGPPCIPVPELCNGVDDDCNGKIDETFHLDKDPANCGTCGNACNDTTGTMVGACSSSTCTFTCLPGLVDVDPSVPGCEYACIATDTVDNCDGLDNDCDGMIDEDVVLPGAGFCKTLGECGSAVPTCSYDACANRKRIHCTYGTDVQIDPLTCDVIAQETPCDDKDNDCDGATDESFATKNAECDDGQLGVCKTSGTYQCNGTNDGVLCVPDTIPQSPSPEQCNGLDDNCNGQVDENTPGVQVLVGAVKVDAYEASRPDATGSSGGLLTNRACSKSGVVPWSTVTEAEAAAACAAAGKRLCTAAEWQTACSGASGFTYPYGNSYQANTCNGNDYDGDCTLPDDDVVFPTGTAYGCPSKPAQSACVSSYGAFDMSGNLKEWTSTPVGGNAFRVRGGAYDSPKGGLACTFDFVAMDPSYAFPNLGFRCCED